MQTYTSTQARQNFFSIQNFVIANNEEVRVKGRKWDTITLSALDYENILEHLYLMKDLVLMKKLEELKSGNNNNTTYDSVDTFINELEN